MIDIKDVSEGKMKEKNVNAGVNINYQDFSSLISRNQENQFLDIYRFDEYLKV